MSDYGYDDYSDGGDDYCSDGGDDYSDGGDDYYSDDGGGDYYSDDGGYYFSDDGGDYYPDEGEYYGYDDGAVCHGGYEEHNVNDSGYDEREAPNAYHPDDEHYDGQYEYHEAGEVEYFYDQRHEDYSLEQYPGEITNPGQPCDYSVEHLSGYVERSGFQVEDYSFAGGHYHFERGYDCVESYQYHHSQTYRDAGAPQHFTNYDNGRMRPRDNTSETRFHNNAVTDHEIEDKTRKERRPVQKSASKSHKKSVQAPPRVVNHFIVQNSCHCPQTVENTKTKAAKEDPQPKALKTAESKAVINPSITPKKSETCTKPSTHVACVHCRVIFQSLSELVVHLTQSHGEPALPASNPATHCSTKSTSKTSMQVQTKLSCFVCGRTFSKQDKLLSHLKKQHVHSTHQFFLMAAQIYAMMNQGVASR